MNNHQEAYTLLGYVLEYIITTWPRASLFMIEAIKRLGDIVDAKGERVKYNITRDHRHGEVSFSYEVSMTKNSRLVVKGIPIIDGVQVSLNEKVMNSAINGGSIGVERQDVSNW